MAMIGGLGKVRDTRQDDSQADSLKTGMVTCLRTGILPIMTHFSHASKESPSCPPPPFPVSPMPEDEKGE